MCNMALFRPIGRRCLGNFQTCGGVRITTAPFWVSGSSFNSKRQNQVIIILNRCVSLKYNLIEI